MSGGTTPRLNLVAYGYVDRDGGSVASASYLVVDRLLALGHSVEFHAISGFLGPGALIDRPGFSFVPTRLGPVDAGWRLLEAAVPARLRGSPNLAYSQLSNALYERAIGREIRRRHAARPFDALLVLGMLPPFRVPGLPCLSWPQGAPNGEWRALRDLRPTVVRQGGVALYHALRIFYARKQAVARRAARRADVLLCGSRWSADNWAALGVPRAACHALPYPVDLDHFRPDGPGAPEPGVVTFLWLGRVVPRKRLDLLLDAYALLRRERADVRLKVVGRFGYARRARSLLDRFGPGDGVGYEESVPRGRVPELLRGVDVLVQPSENEDVGSSVLEALACGTVPVVGPTNGTRDYLSPSSVVFHAYTPESLRDAMARAALVARGGGFAAEARATAERTFSVDAVVSRVESLLTRLQGGPAPL